MKALRLLTFSLTILMSNTLFAAPNTVSRCVLTEWCTLPRISDVAVFPVTKAQGDNYTCTLMAEGNAGKIVKVRVSSGGGYELESNLVFSTLEDETQIVDVAGSFVGGPDGRLVIRRLNETSMTKNVFVMCEKKFSH